MKVLFSANTYHLKTTGSSQFFIDLLRQVYDTEVISHKEIFSVPRLSQYDLLVVWQHAFPAEILKATGIRRIVYVPMFDDLPKDQVYWDILSQLGVSILCFSRALHKLVSGHGLRCFYTQYYTKPSEKCVPFSQGIRGFFWERSPFLQVSHVLKLTENLPMSFWHFHGETEGSQTEALRLPFKRTTWFSNKKEYEEQLASCNFFVAPRRREGIGMSFLEALSRGFCVLAHDESTMNEYIEHGVDGLLFTDVHGPLPPYFNLQMLGEKAQTRAIEGYKLFQRQVPEVFQFLSDTPEQPKSNYLGWMRGKSINLLRLVFRILKTLFAKKI